MKPFSPGFSLVELLVATAISLLVTALACALAIGAQGMWRADTARVDLQQRARVASDGLSRMLLDAGAGPISGPSAAPLILALPPIVPRRIGVRNADAASTVRPDAFSVISATGDAEHGTLLLPAPAGAGALDLSPSGCDLPACGFDPGEQVLLHDSTGNYDVFSVTAVQGLTLSVRHHGSGSAVSYPAGSPVIAVQSATCYLDRGARLLRQYDGDNSDLPLLDEVVGMEVEYAGDVLPPLWPRPPAGLENCLYDSSGAYRASLMPVLAGSLGPVTLAPAVLADGPWCGQGPNQFDADLLRVRSIRLRLRLQAPDPVVRGSSSALFANRGTAQRSGDTAPDVVVNVEVAPRNLRRGLVP